MPFRPHRKPKCDRKTTPGKVRLRESAALVALALLSAANATRADNYDWFNGDGQFDQSSNWTDESTNPPSNSVPGAGDIVNFGNGSVSFGGDTNYVAYVGGDVTFDLSGGNYTVTDFTQAAGSFTVTGSGTFNAGSMFVGDMGSGNLLVGGGSTLSCNQLVVGDATVEIASATVMGTTNTGILGDGGASNVTVDKGGVWNNASNIYIGDGSSATLTIQNGGVLKSDQSQSFNSIIGGISSGSASVTGTGSTWTEGADIFVGFAAAGTLNITMGGVVNSAAGLVSYNFSGGGAPAAAAAGQVLIDGKGSQWNAPQGFYIGDTGSGTVTLSNSGSLNVGMGNLSVGEMNGGTGVLSIESGSSAAAATCAVGDQQGSVGTLTVNGSNSKLTLSGGLQVGEQGAGTMNISNQGSVTVSSLCVIGDQSSATGTLTVAGMGSQLALSSFLDIANQGTGTLVVSGGASLTTAAFCNMADQKGATALVKITDMGTSWQENSFCTVGIAGTAELDVLNGASLTLNNGVALGQSATGTGTLTVDGLGSVADSTTSPVFVGGAGSGNLNITTGGQMTASGLVVAQQASASAISSIVIDGMGSQLTITNDVASGFWAAHQAMCRIREASRAIPPKWVREHPALAI